MDWHNKRTGKSTSSFQGNGNGIKLGGDGAGGQSKGTHLVTHCVAFNNNKTSSVKGFDQNSHKGGLLLHHCLAFENGYNYMFETPASGAKNTFRNNVSIKGTRNDYEIEPIALQQSNSWNTETSVIAKLSDYITLTELAAKAPRHINGTLPNNGFARLVAGSSLIDKGTKIDSVPFLGVAPDLGPYEYGQTITSTVGYYFSTALSYYLNPFTESITVQLPGSFNYEISMLNGKVIETGTANDMLFCGENLPHGIYLIKVVTSDKTYTKKIYIK